jgi:hypothetical protein
MFRILDESLPTDYDHVPIGNMTLFRFGAVFRTLWRADAQNETHPWSHCNHELDVHALLGLGGASGIDMRDPLAVARHIFSLDLRPLSLQLKTEGVGPWGLVSPTGPRLFSGSCSETCASGCTDEHLVERDDPDTLGYADSNYVNNQVSLASVDGNPLVVTGLNHVYDDDAYNPPYVFVPLREKNDVNDKNAYETWKPYHRAWLAKLASLVTVDTIVPMLATMLGSNGMREVTIPERPDGFFAEREGRNCDLCGGMERVTWADGIYCRGDNQDCCVACSKTERGKALLASASFVFHRHFHDNVPTVVANCDEIVSLSMFGTETDGFAAIVHRDSGNVWVGGMHRLWPHGDGLLVAKATGECKWSMYVHGSEIKSSSRADMRALCKETSMFCDDSARYLLPQALLDRAFQDE